MSPAKLLLRGLEYILIPKYKFLRQRQCFGTGALKENE